MPAPGQPDGKDSKTASETELKFEISAADLKILADHPACAGEPKTAQLRSTYFDTPNFDLRRRGLSLRLRKAGRSFLQTVKRTHGSNVFQREEWESKVPGPILSEEALRETPAGAVLKKAGEPIQPLFASVNTRQLWVYSQGGAVIEVTVDKGRIEAGDKREPILELELELKSGDPKKLYALARSLFALSPLRLSLTTKYVRGYRLITGESGLEGKANLGLAPGLTVGEAFASVIRACLMQVASAADILQRTRQAEGVHQTRVGLRRMRTALNIFEGVAKDDLYPWIDTEIRWLAGELGEARELDVYIGEAFQPAASGLDDGEATARYGEVLEISRTAAYDRAVAAIASGRFARLLLEIALWVEDGAWRTQGAPDQVELMNSLIGPFAVSALRQLRRKVRDKGEDLAELDVDHRHKLRIQAKRLRYATQFFAEAFVESDKRRRKFEGALKALQTSLGQLNDIAAASERAREALRANPEPELAFTAGQVVGRIRLDEPRILAQAVDAYQGFAKSKRYWPKGEKKAKGKDKPAQTPV